MPYFHVSMQKGGMRYYFTMPLGHVLYLHLSLQACQAHRIYYIKVYSHTYSIKIKWSPLRVPAFLDGNTEKNLCSFG